MSLALPNTSERAYAQGILTRLQSSGWSAKKSSQYDRRTGLLAEDLIGYVMDTQPHLLAGMGTVTENTAFLNEFRNALHQYGTAHILKHGFAINGKHVRPVGFRPQYRATAGSAHNFHPHNRFSVIQELVYGEGGGRLDFACFLNGIHLFTFEVKSELSRQTMQDAVTQYRLDRNPKDDWILMPIVGAIAHFAVSQGDVHFTTRLEGAETKFLPFNKGEEEPNTDDLWERVLVPDNVLTLIEYFVFQKGEERAGDDQRAVLFPRYHQWEAVMQILSDICTHGVGQRYLSMHSAGSGKSNTIAWLASILAYLTPETLVRDFVKAQSFDAQQEGSARKIFDKVIIVTDRLVLDRQLGDVLRFMHASTQNQIITCGDTGDLDSALEGHAPIIVTTIQKFPHLQKRLAEEGAGCGRRGKRLHDMNFAVLIDEAHQSQGKSLYNDMVASLTNDLNSGRDIRNLSFFAFTATPSTETLELFGKKNLVGDYEPFHVYSMTQAIEEGFILDVRKGYLRYRTKVHAEALEAGVLVKGADGGLIHSAIHEDPTVIRTKAAFIVRNFTEKIAHRLEGTAQAMVVCESRKSAAQFKQAIDAAIEEAGLMFESLCAFTGNLEIDGAIVDECSINGLPKNTDLAKTFIEHPARYKFLIVADKYQVGFDCPRLVAMYLDKKVSGIATVQTLSRLNRVFPGKESTLVVDFVNDEAEVMAAFDPYLAPLTVISGDVMGRLNTLAKFILQHTAFPGARIPELRGAAQDDRALYAFMRDCANPINALDEEVRATLLRDLNEFHALYLYAENLHGEATQYRLMAQFIGVLLRYVDKRSAARHAGLPIKVVLSELEEVKKTEGQEEGDEHEPSMDRVPIEGGLHSSRQAYPHELEGILQSISSESFPEASSIIGELIRILCADAVVIMEARNNPFEVFVREGSAMTRLNAIAFEMVVSDSANVEFVMDNLVGRGGKAADVQLNVMKVVFRRITSLLHGDQ